MTTEIVDVPPAPVVPTFPALGSNNYNDHAYAAGTALPELSAGIHAIGVAAKTNAIAAKEQAQAAQASRQQAAIETAAIKDAAAAAAVAAADSAAAAAAVAQTVANFFGRWDELAGPLPKGATVYYAGGFWVLLEPLASAELAEPGTSVVWAKTGGGIDALDYGSRAVLRTTAGTIGDQAIIDGLGLFGYQDGSTEPDDDESCFATATGCWLLQAPHWDLVDAWLLPEVEERDEYDAQDPGRFASSFAASFGSKVITGAAACSITSVGATSSVSFTGKALGAFVGDRVIATPPAELGANSTDTGRLSYHAWVSGGDAVTVMLTNSSAATANTNAAVQTTWLITVIKP